MSLKKYLAVAAVSVSLGLGATSLRAQGIVTGSVTGTVQDQTGAVVPGATITARNLSLGQDFTATSAGNGEFSFSTLPIGEYALVISRSGFADTKIGHVVVETGKSTGLGVEKIGVGATEVVEVSTAQNLLETVQSQVTTTFDSEQIQNLPTGGGFDELALLIPGVVSTHGNNRSNTNGAGISSNGQRGRSNNFEIDGQSNNDNSVTGPQIFFSNPDALQEVQIITNNFSAQYGRDAGSVVNYLTKSGTNQIHGTAFEYYEGSWLTSLTQGQKGPQFGYCLPGQDPVATGCFVPHKPRFDQNLYGGTIGGPILKDRLFAFGSAELGGTYNGINQVNSNSIGATTGYTPTPAGLAALAAAFPSNAGVQSLVKFGPYASTVGTVVPIAGTTYNVPFSDGTTTTTIPVSLYQRSYNSHSTDEEVLGRLDYQATKRDRFFLRYFYQKAPSFLASGTAITGGLVNVTDLDHSVGADWSHTFGPRIVNQIRYSFQQSTVNFDGGGFPACTVNALANCPASLGISTGYPQAATPTGGGAAASITPIASFGLSTSYPQGRIVKDTQVIDNLSLNFGKHTITLGGSFEYQNSPNTFLPNISGGFTFFGGNGLLQDAGQVGLAIGTPKVHFTEPDYAAYFQDDWKVTPSLTLNLGVRWEYFSQSINLLHNISVTNAATNPLWSTTLPKYADGSQASAIFPQVPNDYKHFEPRLGFAYNPAALKSMVIRGGYAINIAPAYYNIFLNSYGAAPVVLSNTITGCNNTTKLCLPTGGATYTSVHALDNQYLPTGGNPGTYNQTFVGNNFRQPVTQTYSLGIQQQIGRVAVAEVRYVGAHTFADFQSLNANPAIGYAAKVFPTYFGSTAFCTDTTAPGYNTLSLNGTVYNNSRTTCANNLVRTRTNTSFEIYNGLQTSINSRNYKGLTANFSYTFSRTIDNASEIFGTNGAGTTTAFSQNPLDPNVGERGVSGNSYPNVTSLGLTYVDPHFKSNHSFIGKVLGGFQFNTIYLFNSGQPYTPYQTAVSQSYNPYNPVTQTGGVPNPRANFCDYLFDATYAGPSSCRPILNNKNAPLGTAGYNAGNGLYHAVGCTPTGQFATNCPNIDPKSVHWLLNNFASAIAAGNPYPGVGRNTLRGGSYNNMDASIFKNNKISERFNLQLQATFFNALNRAYYGAPDAAIEDSAGSQPSFTNFIANGGSNRNVQLGARLLF